MIVSRGYGMADLEHGVPITPRSVFSLASVSKQFTAASILLLAEAGKLSLQDEIRRYVPELPAYARGVTLEHLIHHTSGLRDYFQLRVLAGRSDADTVSREDVLALLARQKGLNFKPGARHGYSNTGYELLAQVVERVSGQSLRDFAAEHIFKPLGMNDTQFNDDRTLIVENRAIGHLRRENGSLGVFRSSFALVGSGGLLSTVEDLARWDQNFYSNTLGRGDPALIEQMLRTVPLNDGSPNAYAAGLVIRSYRGLPIVRHAGRSFGFRSDMIRFPEQRFSVIVLSNLYDLDPGTLALSVVDLFLADKFTQPAEVTESAGQAKPATLPLSAAQLASYAGRYYSEELGVTYSVEPRNDGLAIHPLHSPPQQFIPTEKNGFTLAISDAVRARFTRNARGHVNGFDFDHGLIHQLHFEKQP